MSRYDEVKKNMKTASSEQKEKIRRDYKEFFDHPLLYIALIASGFLSALAGLAIGLGVRVVDGAVIANLDIPHIFFAALYCALFPYFFEFGLSNWLHKLLHREPDNTIQLITTWAMVIITFVGTAVTAYSAMDILVTAGGFFSSFTEISPEVQRWIAFALPTMFLFNIASGELYRQFTAEATTKRAAEMELRDSQNAADMEVKLARMDAEKKIAIASAEEYTRLANSEAPAIGKQNGANTWDSHHQPAPLALAANVKQETLKDEPLPNSQGGK